MGFKIRGVIIDLDGILMDSRKVHALAWKRALDEEGVRNTLDEIEKVMGCDVNQLLSQLVGVEVRSQRGQKLIKRKTELIESEFVVRIKPSPSLKLFLARLKTEGLKYVLMSSANPCELAIFLNLLDCTELGENQGRCEFNSTQLVPIEAAIKSLSMNPQEIVLLGDSPYDVQSALMHGIQVIGFRSGGWSDQELAGSIAVYDDLSDLLKKFELSPFSMTASGAVPPIAA
jgi:beta-phosphoglucomutase-like phosphatase (HAD superfamily)